MWTTNDVTRKGKRSFPWLFIIGLAAAVTVFEMTVSPAPKGDEVFQTLGLGVILLFLNSVAAVFRPRPVLNATIFTVFFCSGHLSVWFKVAHKYSYAPFGLQFWTGVILCLILFGVLLVSGVCVRFSVQQIRRLCRAT